MRNQATDSRSSAFGHKNLANDPGASAFGNGNTASGYGSTSCGYYNISSGNYSSAFGANNTSSGAYSSALGQKNTASGNWGASAIGYKNLASYSQSSAFGHKNVAQGRQSSAFGSDNSALVIQSTAVGFKNVTSNIIWTDAYDIASVDVDSKTFTILDGDVTTIFENYILVEDSFNNNGRYSIDNVIYDGEGGTIITVEENIPSSNNNGTIRGDVSFREDEPHNITGVDTEGNAFTVSGDFYSNFNVSKIKVNSTAYNNGIYTVNNVTFDGNTHIFVNEVIPSASVEGYVIPRAESDGSGWGASAFGYKNQANDSQTSAFGHKNIVDSRLGSAFGSDNTVRTPRGTAVGYNNTLSNYYGDGGSGWGSSAIGYRNSTDASQASAIGHRNDANGRNSSAIGSQNTATGEASIAAGYNNITSGYGNTAVGYSNNANSDYTTAVGYNNYADGRSSTAVGYSNNAEGDYSVACGYSNQIHGDYSTAIGSNAQVSASGDYSTAIGYRAFARCPKTVNIAGGIVIRGDGGESSSADDIILSYSGVQNIIMSKDVDLTQAGDVAVNIPLNCTFYVDEVGVIVDNTPSNATVQPTIRFGWTGSLAGFRGAAITTNLTDIYTREKYTDLLVFDGKQTLTAGVTVGATADYLHGRFYWKGMLVENTPIGC